MSLKVGDKAPLFKLRSKSADGLKEISIAENVGTRKTLLLFFPFSYTSICTQELCSVSGGLAEYEELDASVYAISVDSPFAQEAFAKSAGIQIPLLSDFNKEVSAAYGVLYTELLGFKGVAKRAAFVINKQGIITYAECSDDPTKIPDFNRIRTALID